MPAAKEEMIGIDIVEISRFQKYRPEEFSGKTLDQSEIDYINGRPRKAETMAGIFAVKEAVAKALGTGFDGAVKFCCVTVLHDEKGCPFVSLTGGAAERLKVLGKKIHVSISHNGTTAAAVAIIET